MAKSATVAKEPQTEGPLGLRKSVGRGVAKGTRDAERAKAGLGTRFSWALVAFYLATKEVERTEEGQDFLPTLTWITEEAVAASTANMKDAALKYCRSEVREVFKAHERFSGQEAYDDFIQSQVDLVEYDEATGKMNKVNKKGPWPKLSDFKAKIAEIEAARRNGNFSVKPTAELKEAFENCGGRANLFADIEEGKGLKLSLVLDERKEVQVEANAFSALVTALDAAMRQANDAGLPTPVDVSFGWKDPDVRMANREALVEVNANWKQKDARTRAKSTK
tara:strand:- start:428 stop:1264 length:837 start_codon:yes stop_codon:yes gene_type:complete